MICINVLILRFPLITSFISATSSPAADPRPLNSAESEIMRAPSLPKTRPGSSFPSREFLSSLVLPAPSALRGYLCSPHHGVNGADRAATLRGTDLLWFSTRGKYAHTCRRADNIILLRGCAHYTHVSTCDVIM